MKVAGAIAISLEQQFTDLQSFTKACHFFSPAGLSSLSFD